MGTPSSKRQLTLNLTKARSTKFSRTWDLYPAIAPNSKIHPMTTRRLKSILCLMSNMMDITRQSWLQMETSPEMTEFLHKIWVLSLNQMDQGLIHNPNVTPSGYTTKFWHGSSYSSHNHPIWTFLIGQDVFCAIDLSPSGVVQQPSQPWVHA